MVSLKLVNNNSELEHIKESIRILYPIIQKRRTFKWVKRALIIELSYYNQNAAEEDTDVIENSPSKDRDFYFFWFDEDGRFKSMLLFRLLWNLGYSNVSRFIVKTHDAIYTDKELEKILAVPHSRPEKL
jgi:hypothetical protein